MLAYVDPIDADLRPDDEDPRGVAVSVHPERMILLEPELWSVIDRFQVGLRSVDESSYHGLSAWEIDCRLTMASARCREEMRELKRRREKESA